MALDSYHHGTRVIEVNGGTRPIRTIETAVIGMVATADDADADYFPLNRPKLITGDTASIGKAGTTGTLARSLAAIFEQTRPVIVVVRVPEGDTAAETTSNVIGTYTNGMATGIQALAAAKGQVGVQPRIWGAPGLDNQAVTAAMLSKAKAMRSMVYARAQGETKEDAVLYRNNFGDRELMLLWPDFTAWSTSASANVTVESTAAALGLRAYLDNKIGWHKTLSNIPVQGVTGLSKDVSWLLQAMETDAGYLNQNEVTTLINEQGYRFWGSRTCSTDPLFAFESATRTAHILADTMAEAHFWAVDGVPSVGAFKDLVNGIDAKMKQLTRDGYLIGGGAWFDPDSNSVENMKDGKFRFDYDYTPCPPMEDITFVQRITDSYWVDFKAAVAAAN